MNDMHIVIRYIEQATQAQLDDLVDLIEMRNEELEDDLFDKIKHIPEVES